jgi:acylphosphatase
MKRVRAIFIGKVQGVFFRAHTKEFADRTGVKGWVRNLPDGSVEAVLEGDDRAVDETIRLCRDAQPHARVEEVSLTLETAKGDFPDFSIRR